MISYRRIQRDVAHEDFIKELTTGEHGVFKEIWRVLLFAAAIGIKEGTRKPLEKVESNKSMPAQYFSAPGWAGFLFLIGISDTGDSKCLHATEENQEKLITAFEEYANHGLWQLRERLTGSDNFSDLTSIILEASLPKVQEPDLDIQL